ncbi:hypothetical protein [Anaerococcus octavius]|uniref:hypothetical protein n=1 Tax=Anaerococcus octavius TaxID=54007 RepID=UPI0027B98795|nr:hypothetical protein [Anaerococcus octavius]MDU5229108.1 hypothetical protein [Anaerococcus sp.]
MDNNRKTFNIVLTVLWFVVAFFSFRYNQKAMGAFSIVIAIIFFYQALGYKKDGLNDRENL